jgi:hypothetical protein
MLEEQIVIKPATEGDPTKCYVCGGEMIASCARCKQPICDEHRQESRDPIAKVTMVLCDECADYYEGLVKPD